MLLILIFALGLHIKLTVSFLCDYMCVCIFFFQKVASPKLRIIENKLVSFSSFIFEFNVF